MNDETRLAGFAPGEAERLVTDLRACLRKGDEAGAHARFKTLMARLAPRIEREVRQRFDSHPELIEDGIADATVILWERLTDLRELAGLLHWERRFHQALPKMMIDAFRRTWRAAKGSYEMPDSATARKSDTGEDGQTFLETAPSEAAQAALERIDMQDLLKILPAKHLDALMRYLDGETRAQIASALGCSEKSVYNWVESAKATLYIHHTEI
jgi:RNA polymerase sigma factor (sigma-70 family)